MTKHNPYEPIVPNLTGDIKTISYGYFIDIDKCKNYKVDKVSTKECLRKHKQNRNKLLVPKNEENKPLVPKNEKNKLLVPKNEKNKLLVPKEGKNEENKLLVPK